MYLLVFYERLVVNESVSVVFFLLGDSPSYEFCMPIFRNNLFHFIGDANRKKKGDEFVAVFIYRKASRMCVFLNISVLQGGVVST